jgi:hypothetical protein
VPVSSVKPHVPDDESDCLTRNAANLIPKRYRPQNRTPSRVQCLAQRSLCKVIKCSRLIHSTTQSSSTPAVPQSLLLLWIAEKITVTTGLASRFGLTTSALRTGGFPRVGAADVEVIARVTSSRAPIDTPELGPLR